MLRRVLSVAVTGALLVGLTSGCKVLEDTMHTLSTSISPAGAGTLSCDPDEESYRHGSRVCLSALPEERARFSVTLDLSNPAYQAITFSSTDVTVSRGNALAIATTNITLSSVEGWKWFVDNVQESGQTTSSFTWSTAGKQPGQYIINVEVVYAGIQCSGSLRVRVI